MMTTTIADDLGFAFGQMLRLAGEKRAKKRADREQTLAEERARALAKADALAAEEQRREWFDEVARQMARGTAGNASWQVAQAALQGRGGRPNPLDEEMF